MRKLTGSAGSEQWTTWQWSDEVKKILKAAADKDFYKLSHITTLEMLAIANQYPDSQFTKACKEYRNLTEGTYFSPSIRQPLGQPLEQALDIWSKFLKKYPDHPGSDDAMYRIARAYEMKGDYENAILWYYKAFQAPDGEMRYYAKDRIIFIVDLLMSSNDISKFIKNHPEHSIIPVLEYTRALHFLREDEISLAQSELENFLQKYQNIGITAFPYPITEGVSYYIHGGFYYLPNSQFFLDLNEQAIKIAELAKIHNQNRSDRSLYDEAAFYFHTNYITYNHFWNGGLFGMIEGVIPEKWDTATFIEKSITYKLVETANKNYELQNRHLKSIRLFEKLLKDYPKSELADRAKYSIGLNYYYLSHNGYPTLFEQKSSWKEMTLKSFREFVQEFPKSYLADDALMVIANIGSEEEAVQALERIVKDYPDGDRHKEAEKILANMRSETSLNSKPTSSFVGVGIKMENFQNRTGAIITNVIPNLPASKSGLQSGDIIVKVDGQSVANMEDVIRIVRQHQPSQIVRFEIERQGQRLVAKVETVLIP